MIQVLFSVIFGEMAMIVAFVFKTPLRKLVVITLDKVKRGRGPVVVKTVAATVLVVMMATVYNAVAIQRRWIQDGADVTPTDQILLAKHLLEASLMGFSLFLALMIDRLHHYIRELRIRRKTMEAVKKQNRVFEDSKPQLSEEIKLLQEETNRLHSRIKQLETQLEEKTKEASAAEANAGRIKQLETQLEEKTKEASGAEANAMALKKQSEGFLLEYDRLLEENQNLRSQLQLLDRRFSLSDSKKVT